jgi:hypothetical protein
LELPDTLLPVTVTVYADVSWFLMVVRFPHVTFASGTGFRVTVKYVALLERVQSETKLFPELSGPAIQIMGGALRECDAEDVVPYATVIAASAAPATRSSETGTVRSGSRPSAGLDRTPAFRITGG